MSAVYPVGSIYLSMSDTNPYYLFGFGTWVIIGSGRTLWGANANGKAGTEISAGLPNITGTFYEETCKTDEIHVGGAFYKYGSGSTGYANHSSGNGTYPQVYFSANQSNSIYGNSSTVQPPAIYVNMWRRTA